MGLAVSVKPTTFNQIVNEGSTAIYAVSLQTIAGVGILLSNIDSLTISLCELPGNTIVNSRNDQNALNANNVSVSADGDLSFILQPADSAIINVASGNLLETHRATFKLQYNSTSFSNWDVDFKIRDLSKVT